VPLCKSRNTMITFLILNWRKVNLGIKKNQQQRLMHPEIFFLKTMHPEILMARV